MLATAAPAVAQTRGQFSVDSFVASLVVNADGSLIVREDITFDFRGAHQGVFRRIPLRYDVEYWSLVFPLGMYTVVTIRVADAIGWPHLRSLAHVTGAAALVAWALTFAGLLRLPLRQRIAQPGRA